MHYSLILGLSRVPKLLKYKLWAQTEILFLCRNDWNYQTCSISKSVQLE